MGAKEGSLDYRECHFSDGTEVQRRLPPRILSGCPTFFQNLCKVLSHEGTYLQGHVADIIWDKITMSHCVTGNVSLQHVPGAFS